MAQTVLRVADANFPPGHAMQELAFTALYLPASQSVHAIDLVTGAKVPASQLVHADALWALIVPTEQIKQTLFASLGL